METREIRAYVIRGHGVASGVGRDARYPDGTLALQIPYFRERGLDLSGYYRGTLNLDIRPYHVVLGAPDYFFRSVDWSTWIPPENFLFFRIMLIYKKGTYDGLVYMPDPATKTDHAQPDHMLEVIMPRIEGIAYGDEVMIFSPGSGLGFRKKGS